MKLGLNYKLKRMSHGFSQEGLCELVFENYGYILTQQQISEFENGKRILEPVVIDYLNHSLNLTWDEVIQAYLYTVKDLRHDLELLKILLEQKSELSNRVMREMVKKVKWKRTQKNIELLIFGWFSFILLKDHYHRERLINQIRNLMLELPKKSQVEILEEMFQYSNEQARFKPFTWIMKALFQDMDSFKIKHLKLLNDYTESLFREKKYLDILLVSDKIEPLISSSKCPEHFNEKFNFRFALTYQCLGYYKDSRRKFREVMSRNLNNKVVLRDCLHQMAFSYFKQKQFEKARNHWNKALDYCKPTDSEILHVLTNYCYMEISESNLESAKKLFAYTCEFIKENKLEEESYSICLALHMRNKALFLIREKKYRQAITCLLEAIKIFENTDYTEELMTSQLGVLYSLGKKEVDSSSSLIKEHELHSIIML